MGLQRRAAKSRHASPRPRHIQIGQKILPWIDRLIARSSRVSNGPVLSPDQFSWTADLRRNWEAIRREALAVLEFPDGVPALRDISPDHAGIATDLRWRSFFLIGYGQHIERNLARCPVTGSILSRIAGLNSGFFSILEPGAHIPLHRGVTKGLLTCHLGLHVPQDGRLLMKIGSDTIRWQEGEVVVFDDTWPHEVWNDTRGTRIILLVQFERPLAQPGRAIAKTLLAAIKRSAFVTEARRNIDRR